MDPTGRRHADYNPSICHATPDTECEVAGSCQERRHNRQDRYAKHCRYNLQETPSTVWSRC